VRDPGAVTRRLAAIMFTDLVGFTRLGQRDEEAALRLRREHQVLLRPIFARFAGREVKTLGDGFLVEFASAVESVRCAVEIQRAIGMRNASVAPDDMLQLRIGLHLGDVVEEEGDVVGDAVNVASRIEPLADPGGIYLTAPIYEQVRNKLPILIERVGPRNLKNVQEPVEIYRVAVGGARATSPPHPAPTSSNLRIAVLPLANLSALAEDEFFADGLTDELISRTAQVPQVRVIARTSVQRYKGSSKSIREVGEELDVRVALEGSIRKSGNRVRIAVQLVDVRSEAPIWSMRYDRSFDDIFEIQDDIASNIARSIAAHLTGPGPDTPSPPPSATPDTADMEAYSLFLHGRKLLGERGSLESVRTALSLFEGAVARDPRFARARVGVAETLLWLGGEGGTPFQDAEDRASRELRIALEINDGIAEAHSVLAGLYLGADRPAECEREARRAMELNPSLADPYRWLAQLAAGDHHIDEAVRLLEAAGKVDPDDINVLAFLGRALAYAGREADALAFWEATKPRIRFRTNANLTEYYLGKGDLAKAEESVREMERVRPASPWTVMYRGFLAARQGDPATARRMIAKLEERARQDEMVLFHIGFVHFALGEMDGFVAGMEGAFRHHALPLLELLYSPLFAAGRADPRIQDILRRQVEIQRAPGPKDSA
jgi:adenylate cyclase